MHADAAPVARARRIRLGAGLAGALLVAIAVLPELRHSGAPGFGAMQAALAALGICLGLIAWLGQRIVPAYRAAALVLLNTLLFLVVLELAGGALSSMRRSAPPAPTPAYYANKPWGPRFVREQRISEKDEYRQFALWKRARATGTFVNVDGEGIRMTPGARCVSGAYRVFMAGGSTMWGVGSPDSGTIPAQLQAALAARTTRPVCVVNLGEKGYTSMQELVFLVRLRSDEVPDLLISYDGVNDVLVASDEGAAALHFNVRGLADKMEGVPPPLAARLRKSRFLSLLLPPLGQPTDSSMVSGYRRLGLGADSLADRVVARYLDRNRMMRALAREYGFDYAFFWQPVQLRTKKTFIAEERLARRRAPQGLAELFDAVYSRVQVIAPREDHLYDISNVFDGESRFIYVDLLHVVPEGNAMIVARMLTVLDERGGERWLRSSPSVSSRAATNP